MIVLNSNKIDNNIKQNFHGCCGQLKRLVVYCIIIVVVALVSNINDVDGLTMIVHNKIPITISSLTTLAMTTKTTRRNTHSAFVTTTSSRRLLFSTLLRSSNNFIDNDQSSYYNMFPPKIDNNNNNNFMDNTDIILSNTENDRIDSNYIKKAGGGIATIPSGNRLLYDPAIEGKVGQELNDRLQYGPAYYDSLLLNDNTNNDISAPPTIQSDYIKKAGYGIATIESGDRRLYDPALEGKVGTSINDRLLYGPSYTYIATTTTATEIETVEATEAVATASTDSNDVIIIPSDYVKKSGYGIATIATGNRLLFDPAMEGKLSDIPSSLNDRLLYGATYSYYESSPTTTTVEIEPEIGLPVDIASSSSITDTSNIPEPELQQKVTVDPQYINIKNEKSDIQSEKPDAVPLQISNEYIKSSGSGIPIIPSGDLLLFNPSFEGKLSETSSFTDRMRLGVDYTSNPIEEPGQEQEQQQEQQQRVTLDPQYINIKNEKSDMQSKKPDAVPLQISNEYIKNSGSGIPIIPSGDLLLFNPSFEGKLSETSSFTDRMRLGVDYTSNPIEEPGQEQEQQQRVTLDPQYINVKNEKSDIQSKKPDAVPLQISNEYIKNSGSGIPIIPSGDLLLFNPSFEGKLSETSSFTDRMRLGVDYTSNPMEDTINAAAMTDINGETSTIPTLYDTQNWLEDIVVTTSSSTNEPITATVLGRAQLATLADGTTWEHLILQVPEGFHHLEGQSISIVSIPSSSSYAATPTKTSTTIEGSTIMVTKSYQPQLYAIASTRYGDLLDGRTISLCVQSSTTTDSNDDDYSMCSQYLCSTQPGDEIQINGPISQSMILPTVESDENASIIPDIILVATGAGIAPFRSFLHRLFIENTVLKHCYTGTVWLIYGAPTIDSVLYKEEIDMIVQTEIEQGTNRFKVDYTFSNNDDTTSSPKYVQDFVTANAESILSKLNDGAIMYCSGTKDMMPTILQSLEEVTVQQNIDWSQKLTELLKNKQFRIDVK